MQRSLFVIMILLFGCHGNNTVYLCNGPLSTVYHKTDHCLGLRRCSTNIEATDIGTAKTKQRRECKSCY